MRIPIRSIKVPKRRRPLGDVSALAESISAVGLLHPVTVTPDHRLVAGLHRLAAARALGHEEIEAQVLDADEARVELVEIDENVARNELTLLERGEALSRRRELFELLHPESRRGVAGGRASAAARDGRKVTRRNHFASFMRDAAGRIGRTPRTVQMEIQVAERIAPDVKRALRGTPIADSKVDLLALARVDPETQRAAIRLLASTKADTARLAIAEVRRRRRMAGLSNPGPLDGLSGKYGVVYADPPYRYDHSQARSRKIEAKYPTMSLAEICSLPVPGISAEDAVLYLWSPAPKLVEALEVMRAWGFRYATCMVWAKTGALGMGYRARVEHELLLIGVRGEPPTPSPADRPRSIVVAPRGPHSEKPDALYDLIERAYPGVPRVELFARRARPGWSAWGNEYPHRGQ